MRLSLVSSVALAMLNLLAVVHADSPKVVDLGYAIYQGTFNSSANITNFLGIRYAAPPVGKLRFQAPAPPLNLRSLGVQLADTQPPGCPMAGPGVNSTTPFRVLSKNSRRQSDQIEDCLFLNVHVGGEIDPSKRMPVVFWIHGGGYVTSSTLGTSGSDLVKEAGGGIVAVELEYRLGIFGFLPGTEVKNKGALNAGLLDQQFALKWIQRNIHLFGGDRNTVTIWGVSAGAGSVLQHIVAHRGNTQPPLFQRAISSSSFLPSQYLFNDPVPEKLYSEAAHLTGCTNATDTFQCLVEADAGTLEAANVEINESGFFGTFVMVPVVDGKFIAERPIQTLERGRLNVNQFMAMTNVFEGGPYVNPNFSAQMTVTDYFTQLFPLFNEAKIEAGVRMYTNVIGLESVNDQAIAIMGESIFICPTYRLLAAFPGRSHKGLFAIPPGQHANDVFYYFPGVAEYIPDIVATPFTNPQFMASFAGSFLGFVKFGDPNIHPVTNVITPPWKTFNLGRTEMLFNRTEDFEPDIRPFTTDPGLIKRCEFWKRVAPSIPQ